MKALDSRLSRRGLIIGLAALTSSCATGSRRAVPVAAAPAPIAPAPLVVTPAPLVVPRMAVGPELDPQHLIRRPLMHAALDALKRHKDRIPHEDKVYIVDFQQHSSKPRLYRLDLGTGLVRTYRTAHGRGSDPAHTGIPSKFSNTPDSNASSVGAYLTAGMSMGSKHGPNVLLDGLERTNDAARGRAIIVHAADYCEPAFLAAEGKLGRSFGCFALSQTDLNTLRPDMDAGRLLFAGV